MRVRPGIMLVLAMLCLVAGVSARRKFNITYFDVPAIVPPGQLEVEIECGYEADYTLLSFYKESYEFFRYQPHEVPSTRIFPYPGFGTVEKLNCGPASCRVKLGALGEQASGLYKCDIEKAVRPYAYTTKSAHMEVYGHEYRKPLLEGLAEEYGDGDIIQAYCRGGPESQLRWYINSVEQLELRGLTTLKKKCDKLLFMGVPPSIIVQCAEFRYGKLYGSSQLMARWARNRAREIKKNPEHLTRSGSNVLNKGRLRLLSTVLCFFVGSCYI